ncbi:hypothetical protein ACJJTC_001226 [Scirpophaga incertulas]
MKKVRFESSVKVFNTRMEDIECHSPRPYIEKYENNNENIIPRVIPYKVETIHRFENNNSIPYPLVTKTSLGLPLLPSNDLELSMLDGSTRKVGININTNRILGGTENCVKSSFISNQTTLGTTSTIPLTSIENIRPDQCSDKKNIGNNSFFIRRDTSHKNHVTGIAPINNQFPTSLTKDEVQLSKKQENFGLFSTNISTPMNTLKDIPAESTHGEYLCHNNHQIVNCMSGLQKQLQHKVHSCVCSDCHQHECCIPHSHQSCKCQHYSPKCNANMCGCKKSEYPDSTPNAVDKKTWMLQKLAHNSTNVCTDLDRSGNMVKEKKEPTVADLFKIIKLQNEQLQYLQEKVDKFILTNSNCAKPPIQNYVADTIEGTGSDHHKISIGVMTSFEMVRTSTVINKEVVTQNNDNSQLNCNRSQISIKEVLSNSPVNVLEGILPTTKSIGIQAEDYSEQMDQQKTDMTSNDKSFNELSLYNVHVDNSTTPLMSPEQSLYLDVRDYSDSDCSANSDDQSHVGWTYYNKVMTHVNGMLHDSDMPSSASALYKNTQKQCIQMQIDKTNVSVTKRVTFGDGPHGVHQLHTYEAQTDTSMKMNQLATKYLKDKSLPSRFLPTPKPPMVPIDMSFATRNYMERHKILQGCTAALPSPLPVNYMPKFLDITAIKQQPKLQ